MTHEAAPATSGHVLHQARYYDAMAAIVTLGRAGKIRARTAALARIAHGEAVLDVGCGTGELTRVVATRALAGGAGQVHGIDASPEMIVVARQKAARAGLGIDFRVAVVEALPFADSTFDAVVSSLMMHHLPDDLKGPALAEIRRVLKPGGRLMVVDFKRPAGRLGHIAARLSGHRHGASDTQDLRALLQAAGFTAVETGEIGFRPLGFTRGLSPA